MDAFEIHGGKKLTGTVQASGAKNAITKMLVATLLADTECTFTNVPDILEVDNTLHLLEQLGLIYEWDKKKKTLQVQTKTLTSLNVTQRFSGANRIPILLIGALLGRTKQEVIVPTVGGCKIGKRPVNFHIQALEMLGASIEEIEDNGKPAYKAHAKKGLHGTTIILPFPSVGATENAILAAVRAQGKTVIENAAIEPEVMDFVFFLQKLGVHIRLSSDRTFEVQETTEFYPVVHDVITDRIEAASLGIAAVATGGDIFVEGAKQETLLSFLGYMRQIGAGYEIRKEGIRFFAKGPLQGGLHIETDVHPGFLTDWQQPFVVLLSQAHGQSVVHETLYENRFGYTQELRAMGASMELFTSCLGCVSCRYQGQNHPHSLTINGPTPLTGKAIHIPDLRAGFAYVVAALIGSSKSILTNIHYLERGYEYIDQKLTALGADIKRIKLPPSAADKLEQLLENSHSTLHT